MSQQFEGLFFLQGLVAAESDWFGLAHDPAVTQELNSVGVAGWAQILLPVKYFVEIFFA
jgi:hypothetical protein